MIWSLFCRRCAAASRGDEGGNCWIERMDFSRAVKRAVFDTDKVEVSCDASCSSLGSVGAVAARCQAVKDEVRIALLRAKVARQV